MTKKRAVARPATPEPVEPKDPADLGGATSFSIVGIGASAGGLEAFTDVLRALPADTGAAFVLVQHLAPTHVSALSEILARATTMSVTEVHDQLTVEPNHVYVIPPARSMIIEGGVLHLLPRSDKGIHRPVDQFFRSLAEDRRHRAIGVVLSGTANDGTMGLEAIKAEGGITFAQDDSAQHDGMPHSAIASGCVDFVLSADGIAREIVRICAHPFSEVEVRKDEDRSNLDQIVRLLHHSAGVDFSNYKFNTFYRRIMRRIVLLKQNGLAEYVRFLRETPAEVDALYADVLIGVTSFFRDSAAFEALQAQVFPDLIKGRSRHNPVRMWVVGCSTGQEAYSLAMAYFEVAEAAGASVPLQVFATDLNAASIDKARAGVFSKEMVADVSPERVRRFFTEDHGQYRISKAIRDACIFSRHNVIADPPFSRIDFISCRNLLIYLEPVMQHKVVPTLHYALTPTGYLWLGGSETIGGHRALFDTHDAKHRIFVKKLGSRTPARGSALGFPVHRGASMNPPFVAARAQLADGPDLIRDADRVLSTRFAPPGVIVTTDMEILQYRGDTGPFLAPVPGKASLNLLKMLREGLIVPVRAAVLRAGKEGRSVREAGARVKSDTGEIDVGIEVLPLRGAGPAGAGFLILFDAPDATQRRRDTGATLPAEGEPDDAARLTRELEATREYLQSVIEQQESANEELQSASEEVQSANEELQSSNEELETSKEEIESSNEELATVNEELNNRNMELNRVNNDLANVIGSVQMAIVIVGPDLRLRRFTPAAERMFKFRSTDVGQPLAELRLHLEGLGDLQALMLEVIDSVSQREREVRTAEGCWFSLRARPYKTHDNKIDGVVLVLVDVDAIKSAERSQAHLAAIVTSSDDAIIGMDLKGIIASWNAAAEHIFGYTAPEVIGQPIALLTPPDRTDDEAAVLSSIRRGAVQHYDTVRLHQNGTAISISLTVSPIRDTAGRVVGAAEIARDITERQAAEVAVRESNARFAALFDASPVGMYLVDSGFRIQLMSQKARPAFGDIGHLVGRDFREVLDILWGGSLAEEIEARFRNTLATGESYHSPVFSEQRSDRKVRESYDWQIHRIVTPDGRFGVVCYFIDITTQMQFAEELRQHAANLSESDHRKNEFLAMLAHELRNPLAPIRNALQIVQLTKSDTSAVASATSMMERQVSQMVRLVDDLLDVSRISRGRIELRRGRVELASAIHHAVDAARPLAETMHQRISVTLTPQPTWLYADPTRLAQIIGNLLINASKYSSDGGEIRVSVTREGENAVIRVQDSGIGLAPDQLDRIFDMFVQVDTSLERSVGGLGIGLTLVKTLVELHGGTVEAHSEGIGQGSEFVVKLPVSVDPTEPIATLPVGEHPTTVSRRILVVDDNEDSANSLAELLRLAGHEVHTAYDGLEAVSSAATIRPEVILLDIGLPKLNGYEACRRIREEEWGKSMMIVALTGWGQEEDRQKSREAGFNSHAVKPIDFALLTHLLAAGGGA